MTRPTSRRWYLARALALGLAGAAGGCFTSSGGPDAAPPDVAPERRTAEAATAPQLDAPAADARAEAATDTGPAEVRPEAASEARVAPDASPDLARDVSRDVVPDAASASQLDPAPDRTQPGFFSPPGGPTTTINTFEMSLAGKTSHTFGGTVMNAMGDGTFYIVKTAEVGGAAPVGRWELAGPIPTMPVTGSFSFTAPLFCGTQIVKCVWSNAAGRAVLVTRVVTTGCTEPDIRVTISWDDKGRDWELHLVKPGGVINNDATDCTWTSCIGRRPDWGVMGDPTDDPSKDVDNTGAYGPENIFLSKPETGRYTVLIEHWGAGQPSSGQAIVNVRGRATIVDITGLVTQHVRTVATIDWPAGAVTAVNSDYDCSRNWSNGCRDKLPP